MESATYFKRLGSNTSTDRLHPAGIVYAATKTSNQPISTPLHFHTEIVFCPKSLHCFLYGEKGINGLSIFNGVVSLLLTLKIIFCLTKEVAKAADPSSLERCKCNSCQREFFSELEWEAENSSERAPLMGPRLRALNIAYTAEWIISTSLSLQ